MKSITILLAWSISSVFAVDYFQVYPLKECRGDSDTFIPYPNGCENLKNFKSGRFKSSGKIKIFTEKDCNGHSYEIDLSKTGDHCCIDVELDQPYKSIYYTP
ncbi:hypothetical protein BB559_002699 [Furculomyces boomerangus]|uniref:Uncharacterized protein n=2 Tax=Harpellales TaxID=61421 RepID=A0A2T9YT42_9FUNG|nr:hypothetical protein BB559_002699 [Furculomyces boomerangus]PVZ96778.1 hypothetical protein BB558_007297 [Smittium angustum]